MPQHIHTLDKLKERNDVKEMIKNLKKSQEFEHVTSSKQSKSMTAGGSNNISEIDSPPRVQAMAQRMGLNAGWALDLVEVDPDDGQPGDFSKPDKRAKALKKVRDDKPILLIISPILEGLLLPR